MKIVLGSMQCEGNSLTPIPTLYEDFDYASGTAMYEKLKVTDYLDQEGVEYIPTIYAHALPGGPVKKGDFLRKHEHNLAFQFTLSSKNCQAAPFRVCC